jgi:hypothetical protein
MDRETTQEATTGEIVGAIAWLIVLLEFDFIVVAGVIRLLT